MIKNELTQREWMEKNAEHFSKNLNGYEGVPHNFYGSTLPLIDRPGDIMDLGCGNGMLLRFLMEFSGQKLIPHGVDINIHALMQAKEKILKKYSNNFSFGRIENYDLKNQAFDILIANPFYVPDEKKKQFVEDCFESINIDGRLILFVPVNTLKSRNMGSLEKLEVMKNFPFRYSKGDRTYFAVSDK